MFDYYSGYKNVTRNLVIRKTALIVNSHSVPFINKVDYFFLLHKVEDLDDVQIYNYLYFFKFFFGRRASITRYKSFFNLGIWTYNLRVVMSVYGNKDVYNNLSILFGSYIMCMDKSLLSMLICAKNQFIYHVMVRDLNFFSESKTNIGLFYLSVQLNVFIYMNAKVLLGNKILPKNFKLIFYNLW